MKKVHLYSNISGCRIIDGVVQRATDGVTRKPSGSYFSYIVESPYNLLNLSFTLVWIYLRNRKTVLDNLT